MTTTIAKNFQPQAQTLQHAHAGMLRDYARLADYLSVSYTHLTLPTIYSV